NQPILEAFDRLQIQGHVSVTPRDQRNAIANEHGDQADDELVDHLLVKKGGDELPAAHQPDVLARLLSKPAYERADGTVHELHTGRGVRWWRMSGEDDGPTLLGVERCPQSQARLVGLAPEQLRVDRLREGVHAIETLGRGSGRMPFEIAI